MRRPLAALVAGALAASAWVATPAAHATATADVALAGPADGIAAAGDGTAWAALTSGSLVHLSAGGTTLGSPIGVGGTPAGVAIAPDGAVWAALPDALVRVDPTTRAVTRTPVAAACALQAVAVDASGLVYFSAPDPGGASTCAGSVGVRALDGTVTVSPEAVDVYDLATSGGYLFAPDFTESVVHRFALGAPLGASTPVVVGGPAHAVTVLAGQVWVPVAGEVDRFPVTGGAVTKVVAAGLTNPIGVAASPRGTVFVTNNEAEGTVYEVSSSGVAAITSVPGVSPWRVAATPDGVLVTDLLRAAVVKIADGVPSFGTLSATPQGPTSARLEVPMDTHGNATTVQLEFGTSTAYGGVATLGTAPGRATGPTSVAGTLSELDPGTTYHVRMTAKNARGATTTGDVTLTTPPATAQTVKAKVKSSARGASTRLRTLTLSGLVDDTSVTVTCKDRDHDRKQGCGFSSRTYADVPAGALPLAKLFRAPLAPGTKVTALVTAPGHLDATVTLKTRRGRSPKVTTKL